MQVLPGVGHCPVSFVKQRRLLGLSSPGCVQICLGQIIGSGIFVLTGVLRCCTCLRFAPWTSVSDKCITKCGHVQALRHTTLQGPPAHMRVCFTPCLQEHPLLPETFPKQLTTVRRDRRPAVVLSYCIAAIMAFVSAMTFVEMSVDYPLAGSSFNYVLAVMGEFPAWCAHPVGPCDMGASKQVHALGEGPAPPTQRG